ncbi:MAG TPA: methyltransferase domain-containing protein [Actinomycetota bacterium]|nr:methyltransferase domain-containing protein [Actinomycetota bacterium]
MPALRERLDALGWWHSFELPDGTRIEGVVSVDHLRTRLAQFPIPDDLRGKRVLDIGAWDGWYSFELERRGAEVVAIDVWDNPRFHEMRARLGSHVDYRMLDVYDLDPAEIGRFDVVLFLGVLYHLKHPLLALERVCAVTTDLAAVDSFVWKARRGRPSRITRRAVMEFFESDEFGGQTDNWVAPTIPCLMAFCRTAGFARVELRNVLPTSAAVSCTRRWGESSNAAADPPRLVAVLHNTNFGINCSSRRDDHLTAWFEGVGGEMTRELIRPEVGGFGVVPIHVGREGDAGWQTTFRVPPGLPAGWQDVRIRVGEGPPSNPLPVAVDLALPDADVTITGVADGATWAPNRVSVGSGATLSVWVEGLPENADRANLHVVLEDRPLEITYIGPAETDRAVRQVNALVPADVPLAPAQLRVILGSRESPSVDVDVRP